MTFRKEEGKTLGLGIRVPLRSDTEPLSVKHIHHEGMVSEHNQTYPDLAIFPKDLIIQANQATAPAEIAKVLTNAKTLDITFERLQKLDPEKS